MLGEECARLTHRPRTAFAGNEIGPEGAKYVADMLLFNAVLTSCTLHKNHIDVESATMLADVAKEKGIPPDNSNHADNAPGKPQEGWLYHDDHC